jgi:hypothetical protein
VIMTEPLAPGLPFAGLLFDGAAGEGTAYLPVIRGGEVRSLLPAASPRLLRRSLSRSNAPESVRRHLARRAYATYRGQRPGEVLRLPDVTLGSTVAGLLGRPVHLAYHWGGPRANRKPVVHALDDDGRLLAVAKLGPTALTGRLVRNEAGVLQRIGLVGPDLLVPRMVTLTTWRGFPLLVQTAVPLDGRHRTPGGRARHAAESAIAGLPHLDTTAASLVPVLEERLRRLPQVGAAARLMTVLRRIPERDLLNLPLRPSHGDWSPQNVAVGQGGIAAAWDWERYAADRPLGYDTLHHRLQELLAAGATQPGVKVLETAPRLLRHWKHEVSPDRARAAAVLMLLDLACRYLGDGQAGTGSPGSHVMAWTEPALRQYEGDCR